MAGTMFVLASTAGVAHAGSFTSLSLVQNRVKIVDKTAESNAAVQYGELQCPCIGIDGLDGEMYVKAANASYPSDIGARCEAWDNGRHPSCLSPKDPAHTKDGPGLNKGWCGEAYCYVDPCNCDLDVPPKESAYFPKSHFQGKGLFYSYKTCGGSDSWTTSSKEEQEEDLAVVRKKCSASISAKWGDENCGCVGIDGRSGYANQTIDGMEYSYPADLGSTCAAWDEHVHPECTGHSQPSWCKAKWCYVDPCKCQNIMRRAPEGQTKGMSFQGRGLYYSYTACGPHPESSHDERPGNAEIASMCEAVWNLTP